jgi:general secretion pathway protein H
MKSSSAEWGFTLVEMLVVLALMSVLLAVSLPYARSAGEAQRLDAETRKLAALLSEARVTALSKGAEAVARFNLDERRADLVGGMRNVDLPDGFDLKVLTAANEIEGREAGIRFFPEGGSTGGKVIVSHMGKERVIAINWLTGAVVIDHGP